MEKYLHAFQTNQEFSSFTNSNNYHEPFVSDTFEENRVDYNIKKKLTFNILSNGYINWKCSNTGISKVLFYSINGGAMQSITSTTSGVHIPVSTGDIVSVWGDNTYCAVNYNNYNTFEGTTCNFSLSGNLNSLINKLTKVNFSDTEYIYSNLFKNCSTLISIESLNIPCRDFGIGTFYQTFYGCYNIIGKTFPLICNSIDDYSFYQTFYGCSSLQNSNNILINGDAKDFSFTEMFCNCSSLSSIPTLNSKNISNSSYKGLFKNCSSLEEANTIYLRNISTSSCEEMFYGCSSLENVGFEINVSTAVTSCFKRMFYGCSSLSSNIVINVLDISSTADPFYEMFYECSSLNKITIPYYKANTTNGLFTNWVYGVAPTGTFIKDEDMISFSIGVNGIPTGWISSTLSFEEIPLTLLFLEDGDFTIYGSNVYFIYANSNNRLFYKLNDNKEVQVVRTTININVKKGDRIEFTGNSSNITSYFSSTKLNSSSHFITYGNTLSVSYKTDFYEKYIAGFSSAMYLSYLFQECNKLISSKNLILPKIVGNKRFYAMFNGCTNMIDCPKALPQGELFDYCFAWMFKNCSSLTYIPNNYIPSTNTLRPYCFEEMYSGSGITSIPSGLLPATNLADYCYQRMFYSCSSLTSIPSGLLPATTAGYYCYYAMFANCTSLTSIPSGLLPADTLANYCYSHMFSGSGITSIPSGLLPAISVSSNCYYNMFSYCTSLTSIPSGLLPATNLANSCYYDMFSNCTSLTSIPSGLLLATNLANNCYYNMFYNCTSLTSIPSGLLPATNLANSCYHHMFYNCRSLTSLPDYLLPATEIPNSAYCGLFMKCSGLTSLPEHLLNGQTIGANGYSYLFSECSSLTQLPSNLLNIITSISGTDNFEYMFSNCTSLTSIPENFMPNITSLTSRCFQYMFYYCTSLTTLPQNLLPYINLNSYCYRNMFDHCSKLETVPFDLLPATTLSSGCYSYMFYYCQKLITAPELPAHILQPNCYESMFYYCRVLNSITCLATDISASNCVYYWVYYVANSGTFYKYVDMNDWPRGISGIPTNWTIDDAIDSNIILLLLEDTISSSTKYERVINITGFLNKNYTYQISNNCSWISNIAITTSNHNTNFYKLNISFTILENNTQTNRSDSFTINLYDGNNILSDSQSITVSQGFATASYTVDLNGWIYNSTDNQYESTLHNTNSTQTMTITIDGYDTFTVSVKSDGESCCDYLIVSNLDKTPDNIDSINTNNKWIGKGSENTAKWVNLSFDNISSGSHTIKFMYRKDHSVNVDPDKAYVKITV